MSAFLSSVFGAGQQLFTNQGVILVGGKVHTYAAGSVNTNQITWKDSTQLVANANPIILDGAGRIVDEIWLQGGLLYKFVVTDALDNPIGNVWDNIPGINDSQNQVGSQWVPTGMTPTFIDGTHFSVPGNQVAIFQVNRRIQYQLLSGLKYGTISGSVFGTVTTVTIVPDVTPLDITLSAVWVGLITPINSSLPPGGSGALSPTSIDSSGLITGHAGLAITGSAAISGALSAGSITTPGTSIYGGGLTTTNLLATSLIVNGISAFNGSISGTDATFSGNVTANGQPIMSLAQFTGAGRQSLSANGYQKFPGGLTVQWGTASMTQGNGPVAVTFPTPFAVTCTAVSIVSTTIGSPLVGPISGKAANNFTIWFTVDPLNNGPINVNWIAIGY